MFTIASIVWPEQPKEALNLYRGFLLHVIDELGIKFAGELHNPIQTVHDAMNGSLSEGDQLAEVSYWWGVVDSSGDIREFNDRDVLRARLAISLVSIRERDIFELGENLSWCLEILGFLGEDESKIIDMMKAYFKTQQA